VSDTERLDLRITVASGDAEADLRVTAAGTDPVGKLAEAAAEALGQAPVNSLWCERRGEQLSGGLTLAQAAIRWGDRLLLDVPRTETTQVGGKARVELVVSAGPCSGEIFLLGYGSFGLGRGHDVDICIPDPSMSQHHLDLRVDPTGVQVVDPGSTNGTAIAGEPLTVSVPYTVREGDEVELGRTLIRFRPLARGVVARVDQHGGLLEFIRPPRIGREFVPFRAELDAPPEKGRRARLPLAASLMPLLAGLVLFLLLSSPVMLAVAGLSPLMAIGTYVSDRRGGKLSFASGATRFRQKLESILESLDVALANEEAARRDEALDAPALMQTLAELSPTLWSRGPLDADFLRLRLGLADLEARSRVAIGDGGEQELRELASSRLASRKRVSAVPLTVDLAAAGVVGIAGPRKATASLARWMIVQAAILQSPGELILMAALTPSSAEEWAWLKWLPHLRPDRLGLDLAPVAIGRSESERLLGEIPELIRQRTSLARSAVASVKPTQLLILIDQQTGIDRSILSAALTNATENAVSVLWIGHDSRDLPGQAKKIVELAEDRAVLSLTDVDSGKSTSGVSAEGLSEELADRAARSLAPIRDVSELARTSDIPGRVGLLSLIALLPPDAARLEQRWSAWRGKLDAVIGIGADGPLTIDLRRDGPHALIAGMTGSGKSELLRTLVAAAAAAAPPNRLSFLLVDYKGGSAFAPCAAFPHVVDVVSDLDEHLAERALTSLRAELKRRERILAEHGAKDLKDLERQVPGAAPPLLVIAVDEFAKLREEVPEFVDGVVDIAQRGRSLGVHMVLAAQTLRNAFTPAIRANTNLRIALRVSEDSESEDVIASPLAARIPSGERSLGRGYARTGHGELREFQTAYVSGRSDQAVASELTVEPFTVAQAMAATSDSPAVSSDADSDLTELAEAAREAQLAMNLPVPTPPWLPILPPLLALDALADHRFGDGRVAIGLVDLPALQRQDPLVLDLVGAGHVAVYGASNSGKTTLLCTVALALARSSTPAELCVYGLDAAGAKLAELSDLPHSGGIVLAHEEERLHRLMRLLVRRIDDADSRREQRVVLLLDDFDAFAQRHNRPGVDSAFQLFERVLAGGRAAGIHVVLSASRRGSLSAPLAAHVGQRLALRMPTEEELLSLGLVAKAVKGATLSPGRGFTQDGNEFQVAIPVRDGAPQTVAEAVEEIDGPATSRAWSIEVLPSRVSRAELTSTTPDGQSIDGVPIALSDDDLSPATIDLSQLHFLVIGSYRSGRSTTLETIARGIAEASPNAPIHLLSPRPSPLRDSELWASMATGLSDCESAAARLLEEVEGGVYFDRPAFLVVDDAGELTDARIAAMLERVVRLSRDTRLRVLAAVETGAARGIGSPWIRELRREGHGLLLQPDLDADGDLLGVRLPRRVAAPLVPGRGFIVVRGVAELVHVAS
jgi:S-DNA-T family DNA segregation ATPase FtsK/SpoIIIE